MSCPAVLVHAIFGQFISWSRARAVWHPGQVPLVCARTDPCLSFTARSCLSQAAHRETVRRCSVGQLVCEEAVEVRLSCRAAPTDRSPGLRPCADVREAQTLRGPCGRSRRLSQPLLVWAGPLREPVEPCGRPCRVISARGVCSLSGHAGEGGTGLGGRLWSPGSSADPLPPRQLGAGFGGLAGACLSTCWSCPGG